MAEHEEYRQDHIRNFCIIAHVDHGKSTLVKALTGIDPDRLAEEKERGMTIDLGFAWLKLPGGREVSGRATWNSFPPTPQDRRC